MKLWKCSAAGVVSRRKTSGTPALLGALTNTSPVFDPAVRKTYDTLGHEKIIRIERLDAGRVGHSVKLSSPQDVNSQLMEWLSRAYRLQARR